MLLGYFSYWIREEKKEMNILLCDQIYKDFHTAFMIDSTRLLLYPTNQLLYTINLFNINQWEE